MRFLSKSSGHRVGASIGAVWTRLLRRPQKQEEKGERTAVATSAPLSIHPDPSFFVQGAGNPFPRICRVIDVSDGGVIGITGERGAGKSVLLNKVDEHYAADNLTVTISSPISSSKEMEFFLMLFRQLVQRVIIDLRGRVDALRDDIATLGTEAVRRDRRLLRLSYSIVFAAVLLVVSGLFGQYVLQIRIREVQSEIGRVVYRELYEGPAVSQSQTGDNSSSQTAPSGESRRLTELRDELKDLQGHSLPWAGLQYIRFGEWYPLLQEMLVLLVAATLVWVVGQPLIRRFRRRSRATPLDRGLLIHSERLAAKLDYELTRTMDRGLELSPTSWLKGTAKVSKQEKARSISIPELTSNYIEFVSNVLRVYPGKLIVCIDELDKVTDLDQIRFILREIKGALYAKGTYYLLSVSNDAIRSFEGRMGDQRDIFESTFDDVFPVRALDLPTCIAILKKRMQGSSERLRSKIDDESGLGMIAVFSAGNARDLIRGFRECVLSGEPGTLPAATEIWTLLFARRLDAIRDRATVAGGSPELRLQFIPLLKSEASDWANDADRFSDVRKQLHSYIVVPGRTTEDIQLGQRFIKYSAEIEILARARSELASQSPQRWHEVASYLMSAYQILPFSLSDCEALLDGYGRYLMSDRLMPVSAPQAPSPLEQPVSDRSL